MVVAFGDRSSTSAIRPRVGDLIRFTSRVAVSFPIETAQINKFPITQSGKTILMFLKKKDTKNQFPWQ